MSDTVVLAMVWLFIGCISLSVTAACDQLRGCWINKLLGGNKLYTTMLLFPLLWPIVTVQAWISFIVYAFKFIGKVLDEWS